MKFALCGAHGQGKTTTMRHLFPLMDMKYSFITNQTRPLMKYHKINENATDETQRLIMNNATALAELELQFIADRSIWDCMAYTWALRFRNQISDDTYVSNQWSMSRVEDQYTMFFYLPPVLDLVDDGVRSLDEEFFNDVVWGFERHKPKRVHVIESLDPKDRAQEIHDIIKRQEEIHS